MGLSCTCMLRSLRRAGRGVKAGGRRPRSVANLSDGVGADCRARGKRANRVAHVKHEVRTPGAVPRRGVCLVFLFLDKAPWMSVLGEGWAILRATSSMPCPLGRANASTNMFPAEEQAKRHTTTLGTRLQPHSTVETHVVHVSYRGKPAVLDRGQFSIVDGDHGGVSRRIPGASLRVQIGITIAQEISQRNTLFPTND